ncbi:MULTISPECIES: 1-hydroxycarotenoid 3,4-desaturase CrtD [unclassified Rubrivivax]|uniref:1-hydroxycarotenoid 3,4-desaturase CrtD n=1 Tax=unclassified Rubrivivax TaxID=2649762 RepID=UPI001E34B27A|nr:MULTISPECIES: 1-hydroxycarotenoid 3,4-desaturase CrtD [unclassified Rubrivivax]MCC9598125.1 phytoene desaturase [Rubrivivax sp. JA1055]MCC9645618.1 phytoene desaturase [Rubrivivax sp. JA1029]MCD0417770.1 phytoene desaturase [Rubrivivax sp. JA1024]
MADVSRTHRVVVVGAGIAGLTSALLLAARGLDVTLVDKSATPGGKMRQVMVDGAPVDAGPTVFTMRWVFDQIFAAAGARVEDHLKLQPLGVLARHAWRGHEPRLDLFADIQRSAEAIGEFSGPQEAQRFLGFCRQARQLYDHLEGPYIRSERPTLGSMVGDLGPRGLMVLMQIGPFSNLWRSLSRHFRDPKLQQLFARYATYCGASPWMAPATLMLVAQVELDGVWAVEGGMHAVARAFSALAEARGVKLRYGCGCEQVLVRDGRAVGVRLSDGEEIAADSVVFNGDVNALAQGVLGDPARRASAPVAPARRSLSALTWLVNARTSGFPLVRHNVFFDEDYASEFDDIFRQRRLPRRGTVYVCAQDRTDEGIGSDAPERLLCLVNAPADGDRRPFDVSETEPCEQRSLALMRECGLSIEWSPQTHRLVTPADFERLFPATGGALYGPATHGWMSSFHRASSTSRLPGLYLAGGSVHPGPGVPMAAMSGRLAAETLMAHLDSTSRSRRVVISGGMSTRSATTGGMA